MRHKRTTPAITITYKFWARPLGEIPARVWMIQRDQQALWSRLVALYRETAREAREQSLVSEAKKAHWMAFQNRCRLEAAESPLYWSFRRDVLNRFEASLRQKQSVESHHMHKLDDSFESVYLAQDITVPIAPAQLFSERAWRFRLDPIDEDAWKFEDRAHRRMRQTVGDFGLERGEHFSFSTVMHRQIDSRARIKRIAWCGRKSPDGWRWWVVITADLPVPCEKKRGDKVVVNLTPVHAKGPFLAVAMIDDRPVLLDTRVSRRRLKRLERMRSLNWPQASNRVTEPPKTWYEIQALWSDPAPAFAPVAERQQSLMIDARRHYYREVAAITIAHAKEIALIRPARIVLANADDRFAAQAELAMFIKQAAAKRGVAYHEFSQIDGVLTPIGRLRKSGAANEQKISAVAG